MSDVTSWYAIVARSIPAIILAIVVTFSADHSVSFGMLTFGLFAVATGAIILVSVLRSVARGIERGIGITQGLITAAVGLAALAAGGSSLSLFILLISSFAAVTGFLELYLGLRGKNRSAVSRDHAFVGALTVLLAVVVLVIPADFVQPFTGPDGVARELTASIIIVGALGAYWAIVGIYLVIAGLSLKWAPSAVKKVEAS
jgi:uncharacterized membrane protein HdeD (DUF308 family)